MNDQPFDLDPSLIDRFASIVGDKYALRDQVDIAPYITERRGLWHGRTS
ncbi:hydroxyacid dehydrogenase, partial [Mesorhizobium sp. M00.F.Ca.ET.149.01.1.1]